MRDLNDIEQGLAEDLCEARWKKNADHEEPPIGDTACSGCRADIVRLVDAAPRAEKAGGPTTAGPMPEVREEKLRATFAAIERFLPTEHVEGCGYRQDDMDEYGGCDCGTFAARQAFEALEDIAYGRAADIRAAMGALGRLYNYNVNPDAESAERDRLTVLALLEWAAGMKGGAK